VTDLQYMVRASRHARHSEAASSVVRQSLEAAGYRIGEGGLVASPPKVCRLVAELVARVTTLLDEADSPGVPG
jgi:hypothetical protein